MRSRFLFASLRAESWETRHPLQLQLISVQFVFLYFKWIDVDSRRRHVKSNLGLIQIWFSHFQALIYRNVTRNTRFFWFCRRVSSHWLDKRFIYIYSVCSMSNEGAAAGTSSLEFTVVSVWAVTRFLSVSATICWRKGNLTCGSFHTFTYLHLSIYSGNF